MNWCMRNFSMGEKKERQGKMDMGGMLNTEEQINNQ